MANPWFKMHADFYHDPKVQTMSETMQRRLLMLFCLRCSDELECLTDDEIQCALRISARQWQSTKALFIEKGFIDDALNVTNWNKRQHINDKTELLLEWEYVNQTRALLIGRGQWPEEVEQYYQRAIAPSRHCGGWLHGDDEMSCTHTASPTGRKGGFPHRPPAAVFFGGATVQHRR